MIHHIDKNPFIPLIKQVFLNEYNYNGELEQLHKVLDILPTERREECIKIFTIGKDDRRNTFIKNFHKYVDESDQFTNTYHAFLKKHVEPLFPNDKIVIQKTPNIRFSFPESAAIGKHANEKKDIIGYHCDSDFGHHHTEMNFIVPITKMFGTNSVYYEPYQESSIAIQDYENLVLSPTQFFQAYLNKQRHYNKLNLTNKTRISFDLRVIPYKKYMEHLQDFKGTKFELGKYYIIL